MLRSQTPTSRLLSAAALLLATGAPALASAAEPSVDDTIAAAKASPNFKRELARTELKPAGLATLNASPGVRVDFLKYVKETSLKESPKLKPLFNAKVRGPHILGTPRYKETILELSDRLIVDRELTIELAPGACDQPKLPAAVKDLCFTKNPKAAKLKKSKGLIKELAELRKSLAGQPDAKIAMGNVTVGEAKAMDDVNLLNLLLNQDARTIRRVSIVPIKATTPGSITPGTRTFGDANLPAVNAIGLDPAPKGTSPKPTMEIWNGPPETFPTDYFLTGFTLGDEIDDTWEYTLANASFWHGRYYVRVDYHLSFGFGIRAPFSVDVKHESGGANKRNVSMKVAPVNVDSNGSPAYQAVELPSGKYFGGNEFVLEFEASCHLKISIPGPDINQSCPEIPKKNYSRDVPPVIGTESTPLHDWWLNGSTTGLGVTVAVAHASLDVGIGADVTNGKVGMKMTGLPDSSISGIQAGNMWLNSREPVSFVVSRSKATPAAGFKLTDPRYAFDLRLRPKLRATVGVDVYVWEKDWTLGPWALDFLAISHTFTLGHHAGTVGQHEYELFHNLSGQAIDPGVGGGTAPPPKTSPKSHTLPTGGASKAK